MANVTGKVTNPFYYKGKKYEVGDEVTMDAKFAGRHEKLNYIKLNREAEQKVQAAEDKKKK
jgi:hypothetical protein